MRTTKHTMGGLGPLLANAAAVRVIGRIAGAALVAAGLLAAAPASALPLSVSCPTKFIPSGRDMVSGDIVAGAPLVRIGMTQEGPHRQVPAWLAPDDGELKQQWTIFIGQPQPLMLACAYGNLGGFVSYRLPPGNSHCTAEFSVSGGDPVRVTCARS